MGPYTCVLGKSIGNLFKGICIKYKNKHGIGVVQCMFSNAFASFKFNSKEKHPLQRKYVVIFDHSIKLYINIMPLKIKARISTN